MRLLGTLLVFACVNGVLYVGQEIWHAGDRRAYEALEQDMSRRSAAIKARQESLADLKAEIERLEARLKQLKAAMDAVDVEYPGKVAPGEVARRYNAMVDEYNAILPGYRQTVDRHNRLVDEANAAINAYNQDVPKLNALADRAFSRWWLIPIPIPRRAGSPGRMLSPAPAH